MSSASGRVSSTQTLNCHSRRRRALSVRSAVKVSSSGSRKVSFGKNAWFETPIYRRDTIPVNHNFEGPAVIEQMDSMLLIFPGDTAKIDRWGNLIIDLGQAED